MIIPEECRWRNWAQEDENGHAMTGDKLLDFVNNTLFPTLKELSVTPSTPVRKCEQLVNSLDEILVLGSIPDSSTKQHLKSDGEGQFHIKNTNLKWHLNSQFFHEWITYKELFELLENDR